MVLSTEMFFFFLLLWEVPLELFFALLMFNKESGMND